jgi:hypothetical protein
VTPLFLTTYSSYSWLFYFLFFLESERNESSKIFVFPGIRKKRIFQNFQLVLTNFSRFRWKLWWNIWSFPTFFGDVYLTKKYDTLLHEFTRFLGHVLKDIPGHVHPHFYWDGCIRRFFHLEYSPVRRPLMKCLVQWYSTGGTRRHLRGYVKFKISIYVLFHEWSEVHNFGFNSF